MWAPGSWIPGPMSCIRKCDKDYKVWMEIIAKYKSYQRVWYRTMQSVKSNTKCFKTLLQSVVVLQCLSTISKWDVSKEIKIYESVSIYSPDERSVTNMSPYFTWLKPCLNKQRQCQYITSLSFQPLLFLYSLLQTHFVLPVNYLNRNFKFWLIVTNFSFS